MKHTELPWSVGLMLSGQPAIDCKDYHIAALHRILEHGENDESFANAAFIVKAVNERESILRDFHGLLYELITYSTSNDLPDSLLGAVSQAQETLKQAEAE